MSKENNTDTKKELEEVMETEEIETVEDTSSLEENKDDKYIKIIEELNGEVAKYKDAYIRQAAELENYKKRAMMELEKANKYAVTGFAREVLNVADSLSRALKSLPLEENRNDQLKSFAIGAEMTLSELHNTFLKHKIEKIESMGKIFDPNYHKVVQEREDDTVPTGTIIEEWQTGYMITDRVLREAMVIVSKKSLKSNETHVDTKA